MEVSHGLEEPIRVRDNQTHTKAFGQMEGVSRRK